MSPFAIVLLVLAVALVVAAEWPRVGARFGGDARRSRDRARRKRHLHVVDSETDEFARAVERDLAQLPTIDERNRDQKR